MLDPEKARERELLLKQLRELDQVLVESQRLLWELKKRQAARLPIENQLAFKLQELPAAPLIATTCCLPAALANINIDKSWSLYY